MIDGERVIGVIPARGGSKGIPDKNLVELGGKPLVAWPIDVAHTTGEVDRTVVSTDGRAIADAAVERGAEVIDRPAHLARDDSLVIDALRHAVDQLRNGGETAEYAVMLEPTCPFRSPEDVRSCLEMLVSEDYDSVATFTAAELNPHRAWTIDDDRPAPMLPDADPWLPRQDLPEAYQLNGGAYAFRIDALPETGHSLLFGEYGAVTMPEERSIDIDTALDLRLARLVCSDRDLAEDTDPDPDIDNP